MEGFVIDWRAVVKLYHILFKPLRSPGSKQAYNFIKYFSTHDEIENRNISKYSSKILTFC